MSERSQNDLETIKPEPNPYQTPLVLDGSTVEPNRKRHGWRDGRKDLVLTIVSNDVVNGMPAS